MNRCVPELSEAIFLFAAHSEVAREKIIAQPRFSCEHVQAGTQLG